MNEDENEAYENCQEGIEKKNSKCHMINYLLTSIARSLLENIKTRYFPIKTLLSVNRQLLLTSLDQWAESVQKRPRSNISLYRPRTRLIIRSYYLC